MSCFIDLPSMGRERLLNRKNVFGNDMKLSFMRESRTACSRGQSVPKTRSTEGPAAAGAGLHRFGLWTDGLQ
jgi:hypothetical protein